MAPAIVAALVTLGLAACDTGDGTTLELPVAETTLPPPDTTPVSSDPLQGDVPEIDDLLLDSDPAASGGFDDDVTPTGADSGFEIFTPWAEGASIDTRYTCDGDNASPAISWTGLPEDTAEIAISLVDESELSNGRPFVHWLVAGIDPSSERIGESDVPDGAITGLNFFGDVGYAGPCPNPGDTHSYQLTVYALGQQIELADGTPAAELLDLVTTVSIESASSTGTATR